MNADHEYLAAGLVLGGLSDEDQARAEELLSESEEFRASVLAYQETVVDLAESDTEVTPSTQTSESILAIPRRHPRAEPTGVVRQLRRRARIGLTLAAAAAVALIVGTGAAIQVNRDTQQQLQAAETREDSLQQLLSANDLENTTVELADGGTMTIAFSQSRQLISVDPEGATVAEGKALQMWVIGAEGPKSAGMLDGAPAMVAGMAFDDASAFGVTVEPEGGSKQPTTDPIAVVALAA